MDEKQEPQAKTSLEVERQVVICERECTHYSSAVAPRKMKRKISQKNYNGKTNRTTMAHGQRKLAALLIAIQGIHGLQAKGTARDVQSN